MNRLSGLARSRAARRTFNVASVVLAVGVVAFTARHFAHTGWPIHQANVWLVALASLLFLLAYAFKAWGWQRLFTGGSRPRLLTLAAAGGAASVTGIALPGRCDEVVRIAVVRRCPKTRASIGAVCLSLFLLGLIDSAALTPLAGVAAAISVASTTFRIALLVVSVAGIAAAGVVLGLPRLARTRRLIGYRIAGWVRDNDAGPREASKAWLLVSASWCLRGAALFVLLHALALGGASIPLALAFLCASAASAALPVAPAGAATQAGAGAAILIASGVGAEQAIAFAVAAQALVIMAGFAFVLLMGTMAAGARLRPARIA